MALTRRQVTLLPGAVTNMIGIVEVACFAATADASPPVPTNIYATLHEVGSERGQPAVGPFVSAFRMSAFPSKADICGRHSNIG
jgi:hypothetical protein